MKYFKNIFSKKKAIGRENEFEYFEMDGEYHHIKCARIDSDERRNITIIPSSEEAEQKGFKPCWSCSPEENPPRIVVVTRFYEVEEMLNLKIEKEGLYSLSEEEIDFLSIEELQREVNHGGFGHFIFYAHNYVISQVNSALIRIGADKTARIVKEAFGIFENGMPPEDIDQLTCPHS